MENSEQVQPMHRRAAHAERGLPHLRRPILLTVMFRRGEEHPEMGSIATRHFEERQPRFQRKRPHPPICFCSDDSESFS